MSHTITITLQHLKCYINTCDKLLNRLFEEKEIMKNTQYKDQFDFDDLINSINKLRKDIETNVGKGVVSENMSNFLSSLSHYEKECSNISSLLNEKHMKIINESINRNNFNLSEYVAEYGTLAFDTFEYMKLNSININKQNFDSCLSEIRSKSIEENERISFINEAFGKIEKSQLPDSVKVLLKKEIRGIKTNQEKSDVIPLIESKIIENDKIKTYFNDFNEMLKNEGFKPDREFGLKIDVDEYSNIVYKYVMINSSNNKIQIILNSNGQIRYKLGNYIGHMCNKTSESIIKKLREEGYNVTINDIKRDIDNNRPLEFEKEMK